MSAAVNFITLANGVCWPYVIRLSSRVRRVKCSISSHGKTELILPQKHTLNRHEVDDIVTSMLPWMHKTINKLFVAQDQARIAKHLIQEAQGLLDLEETLPQSISLPLLNETWQVIIQCAPSHEQKTNTNARVILKEHLYCHDSGQGQLVLMMKDTSDTQMCCQVLQKWLKYKAREILTVKTHELAKSLHLHVAKVRIGAQRGRWGSCSSKHHITLNCRLLLISPHLAEHVILHELCHIVHLDHSIQYRSLLEKYAPHWKEYEKALHQAWKHLPAWVLVSPKKCKDKLN